MTTLSERGRAGEALAEVGVICLHGHFGRYSHTIPDVSAAGLVRMMDRVGVKAIMLSHMQCMAWGVRQGNDEVLAAMRAYPGRLLGYVVLSPVLEDVTAEMERCLAAGFQGLKLHNGNGFSYTHPAYAGALALASEHRLPVLFHTWGAAAEFAEVRKLAAAYPGANFIMAHAGTGGGEAECCRMAREFPNVYLDSCFSQGPRGLVARLVAGAGADKVLFASDCYFYSLTQQLGKVLGADLSDDVKRQLLAGNAARLLALVR